MNSNFGEEITAGDLNAAQDIAKPFYERLAGQNAKHAVISLGLIARCIVEESMTDPGDENERDGRMSAIITLIVDTLDHPAVSRKAMKQ